jgi:hypothetical protein
MQIEPTEIKPFSAKTSQSGKMPFNRVRKEREDLVSL